MMKAVRSFGLVCVSSVGAGLFSLGLGVIGGSVASAAASDTAALLQGSELPLAHLLAATAVLVLSVAALRTVGDLETRKRPVRVRASRDVTQIAGD